MQRYDLTITAEKRPETLERILRVVRHRGFEILNMTVNSDAQHFEMTFNVQSTRAIELLTHQLSKLIDVKAIR